MVPGGGNPMFLVGESAMQRSRHDRKTHVLVVGQTFEEWRAVKSILKDGLQGAHMGWCCTSDAVPTALEAVMYIARRNDLEIVYFAQRTISSDEVMRNDADLIARALAMHEHKPWVVLEPELDFLKPIFDSAGIRVENTILRDAVFNRWTSQIRDEAA